MDFIILKVNGEDVQNCSHEEAMEVFQRAPDPVIVVEVMRRPQPSSTTSPSVFPTPLVGGGGGLCSSGSGPGGAGDSNSELSSVLSTRRGVGGGGGVCSSSGATRSVAVQTVFSAGEMAASLAIAAASFAQQEARMALLGESASYGMPRKYPTDYLLGVSGAGDGVEDEDGLEEEDEEEGNAEDVDDAVFGVDEVGCLDYILKQYPCSTNGVLPSFCHPHVFVQPIDSVYANFPENPASSSSASGNLPTGEYVTEKCFEVILQKQSASDKFGLTLCYRPSEVQQNFTEVYISEIEPGSIAYRSGQIMLGDRVVKIEDQEITSRENVMDLFQGCGLCARITLMRQSMWKQPSGRLQLAYPTHPYPDSTLDIGITNAAYAHLPDQDSGMGRTTDDSVRTEESSEQEAEEHKAPLVNAWPLFDPTVSNAGSTNQPLPSTTTTTVASSTAAAATGTATGLVQAAAATFLASPTNTHLLDNELIHLSQLMQSLAMHCHKLACVKMCGGLQPKEGCTAVAAAEADGPELGVGSVPMAEREGSGDGDRGTEDTSPNKARQTPRMGLGATSSSHKASSANGIVRPKGPTDASAFSGSDYYEAVVMPKQPGNPLTLSLSHHQPPSTHLSAPFDLDTTVPQAKGHASMPPTNPSSIWSIAETDKDTALAQTPARFDVATPFLHRGSRSGLVGSTNSCERQESSTSLGEIVSTKPPIQPSTGGSLSGSKLSCVSSISATSSSAAAASTAPNAPISHPQRGMTTTYEGLATNPAYMSAGMFLPHAFLHHHHPYEFYDRNFKNGLQPPLSPPAPPPPLLLPPAPTVAAGMMPNIRYSTPLWPQGWMYSGKLEASRDACKDDTSSSNIYETPYAAVDVVGASKIPDDANGGNDNGGVCFTSYGVINATYGNGDGGSHINRYAGLGETQAQVRTQNRPLMEWVVKKRTDGTRYITRRPVRNRPTKGRTSHHHAEERTSGMADDDGGGEMRSKGAAMVSNRHHSKGGGCERRRQQEGCTSSNSARREGGGAPRGSSGHRHRGTPTQQSQQHRPTSSGDVSHGFYSAPSPPLCISAFPKRIMPPTNLHISVGVSNTPIAMID
ncbi:pdz domain containing protein [Echinococcus multilocularis]|uniref:Pdz domain containing protein n=1 Tax=Echinococcus multilocularis TaxID=6211 RepID=A0A087W0E4_ECHMU|nr:pdz domain containing protein [Echinococcus multilocularis]